VLQTADLVLLDLCGEGQREQFAFVELVADALFHGVQLVQVVGPVALQVQKFLQLLRFGDRQAGVRVLEQQVEVAHQDHQIRRE